MLIQLRSMSEAVRLGRLLAKQGVRADIVQTPAAMRRGGCGYSLEIRRSDQSLAERTAKQNGLHILGIDGSRQK